MGDHQPPLLALAAREAQGAQELGEQVEQVEQVQAALVVPEGLVEQPVRVLEVRGAPEEQAACAAQVAGEEHDHLLQGEPVAEAAELRP